MADKKKAPKVIQKNVAKFQELVSVKRSIYPWDSLVENDGGNFFIECTDEDEARKTKSSANGSGLNYYMKRKINLVPVCVVAKVGDKFGVLATVIAAE